MLPPAGSGPPAATMPIGPSAGPAAAPLAPAATAPPPAPGATATVPPSLASATRAGTAPLHVPNYAYYEGAFANTRINAAWLGRHFTMTQQGISFTYANAFLSAGGKYAMAYADASLVPNCRWPAPYSCASPFGITNGLRSESSWLHDSSGRRLHVVSNGPQPNGSWQEWPNPGDAAVKAAFAAQTAGLSGNAEFVDDGSASPDPTPPGYLDYDMYKYGALPVEYCGGMTQRQCEAPSAKFIADYGALLNGAAHPVFINGGFDAENITLMQKAPKIVGSVIENCSTTNMNDTDWQNQQNYILQVAAMHRYPVCYTKYRSNMSAQRLFALASYWMVYDGTYATIWEDMVLSHGDQGIMPEYGIVPGGATRNPVHMSDLRKATGVYAREFTSCAQNGSVFGKCAAIVNNTSSTVILPALSGSYSQTMNLTGTTSWYDGGTPQWTAGKPRTIAPLSGVILR